MGGKSSEGICLFLRDEQTGRFLFNARAMQALGLDTTQMQQSGYSLKEPLEAPEAANPNKGVSSGLIERRRNTRRNLVGGGLNGICRQMRVPHRCLHLRMPEQFADCRQPLTGGDGR
jgi:hypothetical protein